MLYHTIQTVYHTLPHNPDFLPHFTTQSRLFTSLYHTIHTFFLTTLYHTIQTFYHTLPHNPDFLPSFTTQSRLFTTQSRLFTKLYHTIQTFYHTLPQNPEFFTTLDHSSTVQAFNDTPIRRTIENIVGKGENAGNQHFPLFPHCFLPSR